MPSPSTVRRKVGYHHGDLEGALIPAVRRLLERDGVGGFSIAEACKEIGVSTAAPYKHFADKQDILNHVAMSGFEDMKTEMETAIAGHPDNATRRIAAMGKTYVAFALANPGTFKLMFGSNPHIKENETVQTTGQSCYDVLVREVARYLGSTADAEDSRRLSVLLWTFVHGVASLSMDKDYSAAKMPVDTDQLIDVATERLLAG
jgi:AcrR family transcriptional regulator